MAKYSIQTTYIITTITLFLFITLLTSQCVNTDRSKERKTGYLNEEIKNINGSITSKAKKNPKMSSSLNKLLEAYRSGGMKEAEAFARTHLMVLANESVQVSIVIIEGMAGDVQDAVESVGGELQVQHKNRLQALLPINELEELAHRSDILMIREPLRAVAE